jgi:hypothetical protein
MLATIEQTTCSLEIPTEPTVTFDSLNSITMWVIVSSLQGAHSFKAPPLAINGPKLGESPWTWTVVWNFVPDSSVGGFDRFEVQFPTPPPAPGITLGTPQQNTKTQVQATITFDETLKLTSFNYDLSAVVNNVQQVVHDPTIVVTPEPIGA